MNNRVFQFNLKTDFFKDENRGKGRTTACMLISIAEAIQAQGKPVRFVDHAVNNYAVRQNHSFNLKYICKILQLDIEVTHTHGEILLRSLK